MRTLLALLLLANICEAQIVGAPRRAKMSAATSEADPTVPAVVKAIMPSDIARWNNASTYGNHASEGYLKSVSWSDIQSRPNTLSGFGIADAYPLTGNPSGFITGVTFQQIINALGFTPYNVSNPSNFITGITNNDVTAALGYTPINPNGTAQQYINGAGQKVLFPALPAEQVNSDWNSIAGKSQILNKPTIPAAQVSSDWNSNSGVSQILNKPVIPSVAFVYDSLSSVRTALNSKLSPSRTITINGVTQDLSANRTWSIAIPSVPTNTSQISESTNLYYTDTRARNALSAGTGIIYNAATGQISATAQASPTYIYNYPTRPINSTAFVISATKEAIVTYSVTHTVALTLLVASGGSTVFLETSANGTTAWQTISSAGYNESLGVGVSVNKSIISNVQGVIPAGYSVRIRSVIVGGGSVTYNQGQERF